MAQIDLLLRQSYSKQYYVFSNKIIGLELLSWNEKLLGKLRLNSLQDLIFCALIFGKDVSSHLLLHKIHNRISPCLPIIHVQGHLKNKKHEISTDNMAFNHAFGALFEREEYDN